MPGPQRTERDSWLQGQLGFSQRQVVRCPLFCSLYLIISSARKHVPSSSPIWMVFISFSHPATMAGTPSRRQIEVMRVGILPLPLVLENGVQSWTVSTLVASGSAQVPWSGWARPLPVLVLVWGVFLWQRSADTCPIILCILLRRSHGFHPLFRWPVVCGLSDVIPTLHSPACRIIYTCFMYSAC